MKILIIADPHIPVPPTHYGGAERIIDLYAEELSRRGHTVHLMASDGSRSYGGGKLFIHQAPSLAYTSRAYRKLKFQAQSLIAAYGCDLVFNHGRFDYLEALSRINIPIVHMAHNPLDSRQISFIERRACSRLLMYAVSNDQLSRVSTTLQTIVIHNFVNTQKYQFFPTSSGYLAFLGRITENKGVHTAIEVSRMTGKPLKIAGVVPSEKGAREYFESKVKPFIDNDLIQYIGPINDSQKQEFLGNADALLFPTQWSEPCAVVVSESLACGTPVLAFDIASNSELIESGITGELCPTVGSASEMGDAVARVADVSRFKCREVAESRFDVRSATDKLIAAFNHLLKLKL